MKPCLWLLAVGLLVSPACAGAICLSVDEGGRSVATVPVAAGDEARLSFRHSIYGSLVEEHFRVTGEGLQLVRRRYAEHRLVEFYGHETARREGEWWVVDGGGHAFQALTLRVSPESAIEIVAGRERVQLWGRVEQGGSVRVAVTGCRGGDRARGAD